MRYIHLPLAAFVVLAAASDWELRTDEAAPYDRACAKSQETCELARTAAIRGWLQGVRPGAVMACVPHPGCFSYESETIEGYNR